MVPPDDPVTHAYSRLAADAPPRENRSAGDSPGGSEPVTQLTFEDTPTSGGGDDGLLVDRIRFVDSTTPDAGQLLELGVALAHDHRGGVRLLDDDYQLADHVSLSEAVSSRRPFVVRLRSGLLVLDVDGSPEAVELLREVAQAAGLPPPVASRPGGLEDGHAHLIVGAGPFGAQVLEPVWRDLAEALSVRYGAPVDVRVGGRANAWLRPPASPHRGGGAAQLPGGWSASELAGRWAQSGADPDAATDLAVALVCRLGLLHRWNMRMAVAAFDSLPGDAERRYQQALQTAPAGRGMDPSADGSGEMVSICAINAGLDAGRTCGQIAADLLEAPAGRKARTRASGRPRANPRRWLRCELERVSGNHRPAGGADKPPPRRVSAEPDPWQQRVGEAVSAVYSLTAGDLEDATGQWWPRRLDRIQAVLKELLRRARTLEEAARGDQIVISVSLRSLARACARGKTTVERALEDGLQAGVLDVEPGDPSTNERSQITVYLTHPLLQHQQVGQDSPTRPPGGVHPEGDLSHFGRDTLQRHDAWQVRSLAGDCTGGGLAASRPVWRRLRVRAQTVEQLADAVGLRRATVEQYLEELGVAGLVVCDERGFWRAAGGRVVARLDAAATARDTAGVGLRRALGHAVETADARCWMPDYDDGEEAGIPPRPPLPGDEDRREPVAEPMPVF